MYAHLLTFGSVLTSCCIKRSPSWKTSIGKKHVGKDAYRTNMVVGAAPTVPASFGTNESGVATPGPATRHAPAGASPVAKRPAVRQIAPVPPAPGRDMTASEMTHALQQVMAQSSMDQVWFGQLHEEMSAHVDHINTHSVKMVGALHRRHP